MNITTKLPQPIPRLLAAAAIAIPLTAAPAASALAEKIDLQIINQTSFDVMEINLSPGNEESWGEDHLGEYILSPGGVLQLTLPDEAFTTCIYDFRAIFSDGDKIEDYDLDICQLDTYTLTEE